jgi:hypothetical protein
MKNDELQQAAPVLQSQFRLQPHLSRHEPSGWLLAALECLPNSATVPVLQEMMQVLHQQLHPGSR